MMGMTPCESELMDVENHHSTDRIPMEMKEKSVAEVMLEKMSETQWVLLYQHLTVVSVDMVVLLSKYNRTVK